MTREEQRAKAAHEYIQSDSVAAGNEVLAFGDFINGAKWADSHPQWIPVEDELPKEGQKVLAYFSPNETTDHEYACEALYNYGFHHWEDAEDSGIILEGVTHWMPIVPPRKEE